MSSSTAARSSPGTALRGRLRARRALAGLALLLAAAVPVAAAGGVPTEEVRGSVDRTIAILKDPALAAKGREGERRERLRKEIRPAFHFEEMARRALGPPWRVRTPEERAEYVALFTQLLENSYLGKIESYGGETVRYLGDRVEGNYAEVRTVVGTARGSEHPVDYRMVRDGDRWRIYDVVIEGVSLVSNYRSQFGAVVQKSGFDGLLKRLRDTVKERKPGTEGGTGT